MNYLTIEHASKSFGDKLLFHDIEIHINKGDKIALVAKNGTGKSTLLKIIGGEESVEGEKAKVLLHKGIKVGFLDQDPQFDPNDTVLDAIYRSDNPLVKASKEYSEALVSGNDDDIEKCLDEMDHLKAWDMDAKIKEILSKLQIDQFDQKIGTLSGGQIKRVALAHLIIDEPDFYIIDEPTNHLDLDMIEWMEKYLQVPNRTIFMVTHDRYFLENVCNYILELENGKVYKFKGGYSDYLEKKALRKEISDTVHGKNEKLLKKELEWVRRMPKARGTKAKSRVQKFHEIKDEVYGHDVDAEMHIQLDTSRLGSKIIELHNVGKSFGDKHLISGLDYKFKKKDRLGIVGNNGSGKTTLINLITGELKPDTGKVIIGDTVVFGYYKQEGLEMDEDRTVIDVIRDIADYIPLKKGLKLTAESLLEKFMFPRSHQRVKIKKLSGGEKRRLYLLTVLMANPNVLILDEPTNDLDVLTLNVLEDYLMHFPGCLIVISHDRFFMDKLVDHLFVLEGNGKVKDYPGTYTEYRMGDRQYNADPALDESDKTTIKPKIVQPPKKVSMSYMEKKELDDINLRLEVLEKMKEELVEKFNAGKVSEEDMPEKSKELGDVQEELDEKEMRWMELMEIKEG